MSVIALTAALATAARAGPLPVSGVVAQGSASIVQNSSTQLTVTQTGGTGARAVVNWSSFSVGAGSTVTFVQPDQTSAILNRVGAGASASQIDGTISSNGAVFLINPNGIAISGTGVVNTLGGFVASTLNITDANFLSGTLSFSGTGAGSVSNAGQITTSSGAYVALLGSSVSNSGTITVPLGKVALGAATEATLDLNGDGFLQVLAPTDADPTTGGAFVSNSGQIQANGGTVTLAASVVQSAVREAVNMSGGIEAQTVNGVSGDVTLSSNAAGAITIGGTIDASAPEPGATATNGPAAQGGVVSLTAGGALTVTGTVLASGNASGSSDSGGRIDATGSSVSLVGATLDASGDAMGGLIRIGGGYRLGLADDGSQAFQWFSGRFGTLPTLANAETVSVDANSTLSVNGSTGGALIVSSLQNTSMPGSGWFISGANGALEVSSQGVISALGLSENDISIASHIFIGAQTINIQDTDTSATPDGTTTVLSRDALATAAAHALTATIEAGDTLTVQDGFAIQANATFSSYNEPHGLQALTLSAGRGVSLSGVIEAFDADISVTANDPSANAAIAGARAYGPSFIDTTSAQFGYQYVPNSVSVANDPNLSFSLLSGTDGGAGGQIRLGGFATATPTYAQAAQAQRPNFDTLSVSAVPNASIVFFGDIDMPAYGNNNNTGQLNLSGSLRFGASVDVNAATLNWTNQGAVPIAGFGSGQSGFSANYEIGIVTESFIPDGSPTVSTLYSGTVTDNSLLPFGGVVSQGSASIGSASGATLTITQSSERAVIDWTNFNIGASNTVSFVQPDSTAAILNRVASGQSASTLNGALTANGQVFLINPNGIAISATGVINTEGGFVASSLDIANSDFMSGALNFSGAGLAVSNAGSITAGSGGFAALLGGSVANTGSITVPLGVVALGAGSQATLNPTGASVLQIQSSSGLLDAGDPLVAQSGTLSAEGGLITIAAAAATDAQRQTVNLSGLLDADAASGAKGAIQVVAAGSTGGAISGTLQVDAAGATAGSISLSAEGALTLTGALSATGDTGGRIDATAGILTLTGATVNASGMTQGGLIRLGGAYENGASDDGSSAYQAFVGRFGTVPTLATGGATSINASSTVNASGTTGGAVIVGGATSTSVAAPLNAGGSGGAMAISSEGVLSELALPNGTTNQPAPQYLMLGAQSFSIGGSSPATGVSTLDPTVLAAVLPYVGQASIEASDTIAISGGLSLDLTGGGLTSLTFRAGRGISVDGTLNAGGATLNLIANDSAANGAAAGGRSVGAAYIDLSSANVGSTGTTSAGDLNISLLAGLDGGADGSITLPTMSGEARASGQPAYFGSLTLSAAPGATIVFNGDVSTSDGANATQVGALTITGNLGFAANTVIASNQLTWTNSAAATVSGIANGQSNFSATAALENNGVVVDRGVLLDGVNARLNFLGLEATQNFTSTYGPTAADLAADVLQLRSGSLQAGDTLATILAPGSITVSSSTSGRLQAGVQALTVTTPTGLPAAGDKAGYFFDMTAPTNNQVDITPATLTYTASNAQSTYGTLAAPSASLTGVLSGDTVTPTLGLSQGGVSQTLAARLTVGSYDISVTGLGGAQSADYVVAATGNQDGTLTVSPKPLTYTGPALTATYGDTITLSGGVFSGVLSGDVVSAALALREGGSLVQPATRQGAGTYAVALTGLSGANAIDYSIATGAATDGSLLVAPLTITATVASPTYTYGSPQTLVSLSGVLTGDNVAPVVEAAGGAVTLSALTGGGFGFAQKTAAGSYAFTLESLGGSNSADYSLSLTTAAAGLAAINPKPLTWSVADVSTTYGTLAAPVVTLNGVLSGDNVVGTVEAQSGGDAITLGAKTSAGSYSLIAGGLTGAAAGNYVLASVGDSVGVLAIAQKPITFSIADVQATYGTLAAPSVVLNGVLSGDAVTGSVAVTSGGASVVLGARTSAGAYDLGLGGLLGASASNYTVSGGTGGLLTIAPLSIDYTVASVNSVYGTLAQPVATLTGVLSGDDVSPVLSVTGASGAATLAARTSAGSYTATVDALSGAAAGDYVLNTGTSGAITIAPKPITYAIASGSSVYGNLYTPSATLTGVLSGDDVSSLIAAQQSGQTIALAARSNAGSYQLTVAGLSGVQAIDYTVAASGNTSGVLTIAPRPVSYSGTYTQEYGGGVAISEVLSGVLIGDTLTSKPGLIVNGAAVPYASQVGPNLFFSTDVGAYKLVPTNLVGLSGTLASNYTADLTTTAQLTITARPLEVPAYSGEITYGQATSSNGVTTITETVGNVLSQDTGDVSAVYQVLGSVSGAGQPVVGQHGLQAISLTGSKGMDYSIEAVDAGSNLQVAPLTLSYAFSGASSRTYGASTLPTATVNGLLTGDDVGASVQLVGASSTGSRTGAGSYPLALALSGADSGNYLLAGAPSGNLTTFTINPIIIGLSSSFLDQTYGSFSTSALTDAILPGDSVAIFTNLGNGLISSLPSTLAAGSYGVKLTGLGGVNAGGYVISPAAAAGETLVIDPRPLSFSGTTSVSYGTTFSSSVFSSLLSGILPQDAGALSMTFVDSGGTSVNGFTAPTTLTNYSPLNVGAYLISIGTLSGSAANNYTLASNGANVQITPAVLSYSLGGSSVYGSTPQIGSITGGHNVTLSATLPQLGGAAPTSQLDVGSYTLGSPALSGPNASNYVLAAQPTSDTPLVVTPKPLTYLVAPNQSAVFAGATATYTPTITLQGVVFGDNVSAGAVLGASGTNLVGPAAGAYPVTVTGLTGAKAADYSITSGISYGFTVSPRAVSLHDLSVVYGGAYDPTSAFSAADQAFFAANGVSVATSFTSLSDVKKLASGAYAQTLVTYLLGGAYANSFYNPLNPTGPLQDYVTITPRPVAVTGPFTMTYGDPGFGQSSYQQGVIGGTSGLLNGAEPVATLFNAQGVALSKFDVGAQPFQTVVYSGNFGQSDYLFNLTGAQVVTVVPKPVTFSIASGQVFDSPTVLAAVTDSVNNDVITPVISQIGYQGPIADGTPLLSSSTGASLGVSTNAAAHVGAYSYTIAGVSGSKAKDYALATPLAETFTITPEPISVSVLQNPSLVYGGSLGLASDSGFLPADSAAALVGPLYASGSSAFLAFANNSETVGAGGRLLDVGVYAYTITGLSGPHAADYSLTAPVSGSLTVTPRQLDYSVVSTAVFGDTNAQAVALGNVAPGSDVGVQLLLTGAGLSNQPYAVGVGAGSYALSVAKTGANAQDYVLDPTYTPPTTFAVSPRPLTYAIDTAFTFGDPICAATTCAAGTKPLVTLGNIAAGTSVGLQLNLTGSNGVAQTYSQSIGAGAFGLNLKLTGADAANYILNPSEVAPTTLTIAPRPLTYAIDTAFTFGDPICAATTCAAGTTPLVTLGNIAAGTSVGLQLNLTGANGVAQTYSQSVGAGAFGLNLKLTGADAANYILNPSEVAPTTLIITPRVLSYTIDTNRTYGAQLCNSFNCTPDTTPFETISNVAAGTAVGLQVNLTGANGVAQTYSPGLSGGTYKVSLQLTGANANGYVLNPNDIAPTTLTIQKALIGYQISSGEGKTDTGENPDGSTYYTANTGYYAQGVGFTGTGAGTATLNGVYGSDQVTLLTGLYSGSDTSSITGSFYNNPDDAPPGAYHLQAVGLIANANDYQLRSPGGAWGEGAAIQVINLDAVAPFLGTNTLPPASKTIPSGLIATESAGAQAAASSSSTGAGGASQVATSVPLGDASGGGLIGSVRSTLSTNASTSTSTGTTGSTSFTLGNADVTLSGNANAGANAEVGPEGASANAYANANGQIAVTDGPLTATLGGEAQANASATLTLLSASPSIEIDVNAKLDTYAAIDVSGNLGDGVTGSGGVSANGYVQASATGGLTVQNGQVTTGFNAVEGAGGSVTASGTISGADGSVDAGATLMSPGSFGAGFQPTAGYSDGTLSIGGDVTLDVGFGGISLNLDVSLNLGAVKNALGNFFTTDVCAGACQAQQQAENNEANLESTVMSMNPLTQSSSILYMAGLASEDVNPSSGNYESFSGPSPQMQAMVNAANAASSAMQTLAAAQAQEKTLVNKLMTNPAGFTADDYSLMMAVSQYGDNALASLAKALAPVNYQVVISSNGAITAVPNTAANTVGGALSSVL